MAFKVLSETRTLWISVQSTIRAKQEVKELKEKTNQKVKGKAKSKSKLEVRTHQL